MYTGDCTEPDDKPSPASMALTELLTVLEAPDTLGCQYWLGGGWGLHALVGQQTRPHRDLDIDFDAAYEGAAFAVLQQLG